MNDPYTTLGVPRDAADAAIRKAYGLLALKMHPDRGGDPEKFHAIQWAFELLSDPKRRKHYDETGEDNKPGKHDPIHEAAVFLLSVCLQETICAATARAWRPRDVDMLRGITERFEFYRAKTKSNLAACRKALKVAKEMEGRFSAIEGENVLGNMLGLHLVSIKAEIEAHENDVAIQKRAALLLELARYRTDAMRQIMIQGEAGLKWLVKFE